MFLTEEVQKDIYPIASLENTEAVNLEKAFYNIDGVNIVDKSAAVQIPDYTNNCQLSVSDYHDRLYGPGGNIPSAEMELSGPRFRSAAAYDLINVHGYGPSKPDKRCGYFAKTAQTLNERYLENKARYYKGDGYYITSVHPFFM